MIIFLHDKKDHVEQAVKLENYPKENPISGAFKGLGMLFTNIAFWIILLYFATPSLPGWATKNWRFNFNATYDFDAKKISYMTCNVTRNLHCWQMTASFVPVGPYKSYTFSIAVSSALLKDLKYDKRSNYRDGQQWY